jgi:hypothetical protein
LPLAGAVARAVPLLTGAIARAARALLVAGAGSIGVALGRSGAFALDLLAPLLCAAAERLS